MADFTETEIQIRYSTNLWGLYSYNFAGILPTGDTISAVTVRAFVGNLKAASTLSDFTEITLLLIDPAYVPTITDGDTVNVKFQYPGSTYKNQKVTIVFEVTTAAGGEHPFFFQYIRVKGSET